MTTKLDDPIADVDSRRLANYIIQFLRERDGGALNGAIQELSVGDYEQLHDELTEIIRHRGRPPNWSTL